MDTQITQYLQCRGNVLKLEAQIKAEKKILKAMEPGFIEACKTREDQTVRVPDEEEYADTGLVGMEFHVHEVKITRNMSRKLHMNTLTHVLEHDLQYETQLCPQLAKEITAKLWAARPTYTVEKVSESKPRTTTTLTRKRPRDADVEDYI